MTKARAVWTFLVFGILPAIALAEPSDAPMLVLDHVHKIADRSAGFSEPSGLALGSDGDGYWSVSDDSAMIYRLTPKGRLVPDQSIPLPMKGLEGVVDDLVRNRLLTVREDTAEIVAVSLMDGASTAYPITRMSGFGDIAAVFGSVRSNNGLEGISLGSSTDEIVVIKENGPRLLIRISADLSTILGAVELTAVRGFACDGTDDVGLDVSDLTFDAARKAFWILSDEGSCVFLYDPATGLAAGVPLPGSVDHPERRLKNPEGIALNPDGTELRIVTDDGKDSRLAIFTIRETAAGLSEKP